ncbi:hypothetical protein [Streptomyces sp. NPDC059701]|uniref:hypothetical protein n=1 Tax=Streptomyces sp. NPDC059701 TaxID=3346914 RepID=UPI0036AED74A
MSGNVKLRLVPAGIAQYAVPASPPPCFSSPRAAAMPNLLPPAARTRSPNR